MKNSKIEALRKEREQLVRFANGLLEMIREVCNGDAFRRLAESAFDEAERIASAIGRQEYADRPRPGFFQRVADLFKPWFNFAEETGR